MCGWLWKRGVFRVDSMTDFGKVLRERLSESLDFTWPEVVREEQSRDGSKKFLMALGDGETVETALLKQGDRLTACISTQAGCPVGCPFCATGEGGFSRNLTKGEIAGQFVAMERHIGREINNAVFMGMGEPFLNTEAVLDAVRILNDPNMRGLGIRHMTISTAGIVPGIEALAESGLGVRLAVSLHAANDELRDELVPCNSNYPLRGLMSALREYQRTTGDRVTIEYALFKGRNDSIESARELVRLLHGLHSYVNLIPANDNDGGYERSEPESVLRFQSVLRSAGFESEIRAERGGEINAACGQLRGAQSGEARMTQPIQPPQPTQPKAPEARGVRREKTPPARPVTRTSSTPRGEKASERRGGARREPLRRDAKPRDAGHAGAGAPHHRQAPARDGTGLQTDGRRKPDGERRGQAVRRSEGGSEPRGASKRGGRPRGGNPGKGFGRGRG
jgi:23S rRNA (adenine2503-C2)-methyltransferase